MGHNAVSLVSSQNKEINPCSAPLQCMSEWNGTWGHKKLQICIPNRDASRHQEFSGQVKGCFWWQPYSCHLWTVTMSINAYFSAYYIWQLEVAPSDCFVHSGPLPFLYAFYDRFVSFCRKASWISDKDHIECTDWFKDFYHMKSSTLCKGGPFYLLLSSLMSFNNRF